MAHIKVNKWRKCTARCCKKATIFPLLFPTYVGEYVAQALCEALEESRRFFLEENEATKRSLAQVPGGDRFTFEKSPTFIEKSPTYSEKSPTFSGKSPAH